MNPYDLEFVSSQNVSCQLFKATLAWKNQNSTVALYLIHKILQIQPPLALSKLSLCKVSKTCLQFGKDFLHKGISSQVQSDALLSGEDHELDHEETKESIPNTYFSDAIQWLRRGIDALDWVPKELESENENMSLLSIQPPTLEEESLRRELLQALASSYFARNGRGDLEAAESLIDLFGVEVGFYLLFFFLGLEINFHFLAAPPSS